MEPGQISTTAAVGLTLEQLTTDELVRLYLAVTFPDYNLNLKTLSFYGKVRHLFTLDGGTKAHESVIEAIGIFVNLRIGDD